MPRQNGPGGSGRLTNARSSSPRSTPTMRWRGSSAGVMWTSTPGQDLEEPAQQPGQHAGPHALEDPDPEAAHLAGRERGDVGLGRGAGR